MEKPVLLKEFVAFAHLMIGYTDGISYCCISSDTVLQIPVSY